MSACLHRTPPPPGQAQPTSRPVLDVQGLGGQRGSEQPPPTMGYSPAPQPTSRCSSGAEGRPVPGLHPAKGESGRRPPRAVPAPPRQPRPQPVSCGPALAPPTTAWPCPEAGELRLDHEAWWPCPRRGTPSQMACPRAGSALPPAKPVTPGPGKWTWMGGRQRPPIPGQDSVKLGHICPLLPGPGAGGREAFRGPQRRQTPLEGPQTPQICGAQMHSRGGRLTTLPETQPVRGSTAWGEVGLGTHCPGETTARATAHPPGTQLSPPRA